MNTTRVRKIARLPHEIRELLNRCLLDGHPGHRLVVWLNSLPEVRDAMLRDFAGRPVNEQNLTKWRQGGYREWAAHQEALRYIQQLRRPIAAPIESSQIQGNPG